MENFNYNAPAEIYAVGGRGTVRRPMIYRKFATAAEAVRYAVEDLSTDARKGAVLETDNARLSAIDIEALYQSTDYPLTRPAPA